jgi:hypothetical protein
MPAPGPTWPQTMSAARWVKPPRGEKNGNYKTGDWTLEAIEERKWLRSLVQSFCKGSK